MKLERSAVQCARPYEWTPLRRGQANGFKPKTVETRLGPLALRVPQTRGLEFYPSALELGQRSERALKLASAEMDVQGVTTRKVTAVMEELCGLEVTSSQVSRAVQAFDAEMTAWRERKLGEIPYLLIDARYEKVRVSEASANCDCSNGHLLSLHCIILAILPASLLNLFVGLRRKVRALRRNPILPRAIGAAQGIESRGDGV